MISDIQLHFIEPNIGKSKMDVPRVIKEVLRNFGNIFEESNGLASYKQYDHKILLKEANTLLNVRPYRHSGLQKDITERLVQESLGTGVIQANNSLFVALVVLMGRKTIVGGCV